MTFSLASLLVDTSPQEVTALSLEGEWLLHHGFEQLEAWPDFRNWSQLEELSLAGNKLSHVSFAAYWPTLQHLDLSENQIEQTAGWLQLPQLAHVDLAHNLLNTWPDLSENKQLKHLNLSHNALSIPTAAVLPRGLQWLALSGNRRIKDLTALNGLAQLETLFIKQLRLVGYAFLKNLPALRKLSFTPLRADDLQVLAEVRSLRQLHLSLNWLGEGGGLPPLPQLEKLSLVRAEQPWKHPLEGMDRLTELNLTANKWEHWPPMAEMPQLRHLSARRNRLKELPDWKALPQLQVLDVRENPISPQLAQGVPDGVEVWW